MMKKKLVGFSVLAAALTMATGMTSFAAGWKQDTNGWYYEYDNGNWAGCGWFTDPEDNAMYYLDPDGYMMSGTTVEGYKLGDDGRRIEKTEEDLQREAERKKRIASRPSPAKEQAAADLAADTAKKGTASTSTTRLSYQSEMKVFMDKYFIETQKELIAAESQATKASTTEDNLETSYYFNTSGGPVVQATLWKMSNKKNSNYREDSFDFSYNRNLLTEASDIATFDDLFQKMCVSALGETEGKAVSDLYYAEIASGSTQFDRTGNTDTGNYYTVTYRSGKLNIKVVCSEIDPNAAEAQASETTEEAAEAVSEETVTSTVIVAGQGAAAEETAAEETASEETTSEETTSEETTSEETESSEIA